MNMKQMEYILELSRTKNFNRAAENLFISQPALTYQIKTVEEEIGFRIFDRTGKGVNLTTAGAIFTIILENVLAELSEGIRQGQAADRNFIRGITVSLPYRSALRFLPEAVDRFRERMPMIPVEPFFDMTIPKQPYMKIERDITFSIKENARRMSGVKAYPIFESGIYCITPKDDALADKSIITAEDLKDRSLSSTNARVPTIVHQMIRNVVQTYHNINYLVFDEKMLLHNVASHIGVALVPGILNDNSGEFAWIPYDTEEKLSCVALLRQGENRKSVLDFVEVLREVYKEHENENL